MTKTFRTPLTTMIAAAALALGLAVATTSGGGTPRADACTTCVPAPAGTVASGPIGTVTPPIYIAKPNLHLNGRLDVQQGIWQLMVTNENGITAKNVSLNVMLPQGVTFSGFGYIDGFSCTQMATNSQFVSCKATADFEGHSVHQVTVKFKATAGTHLYRADVFQGNGQDADPSDNSIQWLR